MRVEHEHIYHNSTTGAQEIVRTERYTPTAGAENNATAATVTNIVWYLLGVVEVLLALRIVFLLLAAGLTPFTSFLYNLTSPLVAPFRGMFPTPVVDGAYFDTASIVALIVYAIIAWAITALVDVLLRGDRS